VKDPKDVVSAGDRVSVRVLRCKLDKKQIALTMKSQGQGERAAERTGGPPPAADRAASGPRGGGPQQRDRAPNHAPAPSKPATPFNNPFAAALAKKTPPR
jgi:uncharacterized protein